MVLLKSDGSFPLGKAGDIALYGNGARYTIKGGTGSGDVNVRSLSTVEEALKNAGFTVTTVGWLDAYDKCRKEAEEIFQNNKREVVAQKGIAGLFESFGAVMPEPEYEFPILKEGDTAVYILARISGEGSDRQDIKGDFRLSDTEIRDIQKINSLYDKFLLVLNVGGVVDLSPVVAAVRNILLLSQPGMMVGESFADVLLGKAYPSGKLSSTWAAYEDYCPKGVFGGLDDNRYREGIYVGYRYFDSIGKEPLFPFGFGMGYTSFALTPGELKAEGSRIFFLVHVENIGKTAGKEVVQLYIAIPEGRLNQPTKVLAAFCKTRELLEEEGQDVELCFDVKDLASYDERTKSAVLEAGDYTLWLGTDSRNVEVCGIICISEMVIVKKFIDAGGKPDFEDWKPEESVKMEVR